VREREKTKKKLKPRHDFILTLFSPTGGFSHSTQRVPLHIASISGSRKAVLLLIKYGSALDPLDAYSKTPLYYAVKKGYADIVNVFLHHGSNFSLTFGSKSLLHLAAGLGYESICKNLIERGISKEIRSDSGLTPLHEACLNGRQKVVIGLFTYGWSLGDLDNDLKSPMHYAAMSNSLELVKWLQEKKLSLTAPDKFGLTPLHYAAINGREQTIEYLLTILLFDFIDSVDVYGNSPLFYCSIHSHLESLRLLLEAGADPLQKNVHPSFLWLDPITDLFSF